MADIVKTGRRVVANQTLPYQGLAQGGDEWPSSITARRLVGRILKRKTLIVAVFLIVVIPAAIATYLTTPLYKSTALVQVNPDPIQILPYRDVADRAGGGTNNYDNYIGTQEQILTGRSLTTRVLRRLGAEFKSQPAGLEVPFLGDRYSVKRIERSELFELTYLAPDPEVAATVVNLVAEEYVKQNFEMRQATRLKAEQELKQELQGFEQRLQLSEKELTAYAESNNIISLEQGQVDPLQERLRTLDANVATAEGKVAASRSAVQRLESTNVDEFPEGLVTDNISQLESKALQLDQDLTNLRATYGENWPAVIEKRSEIALVKDQLSRAKSVALARSREQARLDLTAAEATLGMTSGSLEEQKGLVNRFHEASIRYNILKREVDTNRNLYDGLLERLRQNGVMAGFQFGNIQIMESGRPVRNPDSPKVMWILAIASLLGVALGVCVAILLDFWDNSISTLEEAEQLASLPSLGSVPLIKAPKARLTGKQNGNGRLAEPTNGNVLPAASQSTQPWQLTESMRAICASILLSKSDERPRLIVVTSATPAEGKTTLVTHLGKAFAEAGLTTLLVEADLRKPDLSKAFSIGNEDGLSLFLAGHVTAGPKIHETEVPNLFVAAGGPIPPNPAALLHSDRLTQFLAAVAADYQVVLVDTPPLSMADARILGTKADGVVLVVRAGRTARNIVQRACSTLDTAGVNVLGMVLNGEEPDPTSSAYYGGYYEYSHG